MKFNNLKVRSFYYKDNPGSIYSDALQRLYLSSGYGVLGRGAKGKKRPVNKGDLALNWCIKDGKVFAGLYIIQDPNFNPVSNIGYSTMWGSNNGSGYVTKATVKELVKPQYVFDTNKLVKATKINDNGPDVIQVAEELMKTI